MALDVETVRASFDLAMRGNPAIVPRFYEILFDRHPQLRALFGARSVGGGQTGMVTEAIVSVVDHLDNAPWLAEELSRLGARHVAYGVRDEMYEWVGEALLAALAEAVGHRWTPRMDAAWRAALAAVVDLAVLGARRARTAA